MNSVEALAQATRNENGQGPFGIVLRQRLDRTLSCRVRSIDEE
ncbi:hypothetical protein [Mesorhizobium sp. M1365]